MRLFALPPADSRHATPATQAVPRPRAVLRTPAPRRPAVPRPRAVPQTLAPGPRAVPHTLAPRRPAAPRPRVVPLLPEAPSHSAGPPRGLALMRAPAGPVVRRRVLAWRQQQQRRQQRTARPLAGPTPPGRTTREAPPRATQTCRGHPADRVSPARARPPASAVAGTVKNRCRPSAFPLVCVAVVRRRPAKSRRSTSCPWLLSSSRQYAE